MKAIIITRFGGPEVLELQDVPEPKAAAGELLIRVRACGVNPVDTYVREGKYPVPGPPPFIAGTELVGEVMNGPRKGERVYALLTTSGRNLGAHAEYAVVKDAWRIPDHLSFEEAAAIPVAFGTAYRSLVDVGHLRPGKFILIHGASGGVGHAATQIASSLGATVIGTASTPQGQQAVRDAGAKFVFNHHEAGYREQIVQATGGEGCDLIIEFVAATNLNHDLDLIGRGGRIVVVGSRAPIEIDARKLMVKESILTGMTLWGGGDDGLARAYATINALIAKKAIHPLITKTFPLAQTADAQREVMQSHGAGKIVVTV